MEVIRREHDDEEVIRVVGNVIASTSSRVMLRMCIGYSALVRHQAEKGLATSSVEGLTEPQTNNSRAAMQRAIDRTTLACVSAVSIGDRGGVQCVGCDLGQRLLCETRYHSAESGFGDVNGSAQGESPSGRPSVAPQCFTHRNR